MTGRNAPILRQTPWQYGKYYLRAFSCLDTFLLRQNCCAPASDVFSSDFWLLRCRRAESAYSRRCCRATFLWSEADAQQGEKGKKRRKDTLSGVFALVNRWYEKHPLGEAAASRSGRWMAVCVRRRGSPERSRRGRPAGRCPRLRPGACPQDPRSRARYTGRGSAPSCPGRPGRR